MRPAAEFILPHWVTNEDKTNNGKLIDRSRARYGRETAGGRNGSFEDKVYFSGPRVGGEVSGQGEMEEVAEKMVACLLMYVCMCLTCEYVLHCVPPHCPPTVPSLPWTPAAPNPIWHLTSL